jgi:tryptophan 7-halogenase
MIDQEKILTKPKSYCIVGSGTAGLISALLLRRAFPSSNITVVSSSDVGIIGVGEGSTEHWRQFMEICQIPLHEMLMATDATHKYGIRYENWTTHTPDYFHSISGVDDLYCFGFFAGYMGIVETQKTLTSQTSSIGMVRDKIRREGLHGNTNQYHFDTFKLNEYFVSLAFKRNIKFVEGLVNAVEKNEDGNIKLIKTKQGDIIEADFWFDASGFNRILMKEVGPVNWESFNKYLLCNTAIPFPTESDPNGRIRPYTRAKAASSGWMWEIPTQERRGNGYVFCDQFISVEEAVKEAELISGYKLPDNPRVIKFDAGYLKEPWQKNVIAVGLASSFVEPLEATSIGSTIQQVRQSIPYLASYLPTHTTSQKHFNSSFEKLMRNILTMIRLHYYSDRRDSKFWQEMANMPINSELQNLIDLWSERPPVRHDVDTSNGEMFLAPHLFHVGQGQGIINVESCTNAINAMGIRQQVEKQLDEFSKGRSNHELVDHGQSLRELYTLDQEWEN